MLKIMLIKLMPWSMALMLLYPEQWQLRVVKILRVFQKFSQVLPSEIHNTKMALLNTSPNFSIIETYYIDVLCSTMHADRSGPEFENSHLGISFQPFKIAGSSNISIHKDMQTKNTWDYQYICFVHTHTFIDTCATVRKIGLQAFSFLIAWIRISSLSVSFAGGSAFMIHIQSLISL